MLPLLGIQSNIIIGQKIWHICLSPAPPVPAEEQPIPAEEQPVPAEEQPVPAEPAPQETLPTEYVSPSGLVVSCILSTLVYDIAYNIQFLGYIVCHSSSRVLKLPLLWLSWRQLLLYYGEKIKNKNLSYKKPLFSDWFMKAMTVMYCRVTWPYLVMMVSVCHVLVWRTFYAMAGIKMISQNQNYYISGNLLISKSLYSVRLLRSK